MGDCSKHKKEVFGESDMAALAEAVGDLHYEALAYFLLELGNKILADAKVDYDAGRFKLASELHHLGFGLHGAYLRSLSVWNVCKPFMKENNNTD